jgi:hypothetical protein
MAIPTLTPRRGDTGVSLAPRDYHFSSCLPVRNLRRYFLGRSIEASMIGPAERLWPFAMNASCILDL